MAEHFVQPPHWEWYIAGYFFLAGLAGGSYVLATILRLNGAPGGAATARLGYLVAFPLTVICPILLTLDLGKPLRFWHMIFNTTPGAGGLIFKSWSPMSVGVWVLLLFGIFSLVSFIEALGAPKPDAAEWPASGGTRAFIMLGSLAALMLASYTGVLLSVSNQPVWSDGWLLGALFLASGLSGSAALLAWLSQGQAGAGIEERLGAADRSFAILELVVLALFFIQLAVAGTLGKAFGGLWIILWILVVASLIPPILRMDLGARMRAAAASAGVMTALVVLVGVALMRIAVIFSAQF